LSASLHSQRPQLRRGLCLGETPDRGFVTLVERHVEQLAAVVAPRRRDDAAAVQVVIPRGSRVAVAEPDEETSQFRSRQAGPDDRAPDRSTSSRRSFEDSLALLAGLVSQADLVCFPVDCISHSAAEKLKKLCQRLAKTWAPMRSASFTSFVSEIVAIADLRQGRFKAEAE